MTRVLVVDDDPRIVSSVGLALRTAEPAFEVVPASGGREGLERALSGAVDAVLLDLAMPDMDGLEVLRRLQAAGSSVPVLVLSGQGSIEKAVAAVKLGAFDFIEKPPTADRLVVALANALRYARLADEHARLKAERAARDPLLGDSPAMAALLERVRRAAPTAGRVLITGENGTGKELVARALHEWSSRRDRPFVKVNCAAVPTELIESELFGHERGAFTSAVRTRKGKFEQADGGTLFLDEVGDMPPAMQAKLLRVLQEGEFERVGGNETIRVDVRVVAATNKDLAAEIRAGRFREDLFYRLNVVPLHVPPLRERPGDIPTLAAHFLEAACREHGRRPKRLAPGALARLAAHPYPGNVRELKNLIERLVILTPGETIEAADVSAALGEPAEEWPEEASAGPAAGEAAPEAQPGGLYARLREAERAFILAQLEADDWRIAAAARHLGLERSHLYKKMRAHGITLPGARRAPGREGGGRAAGGSGRQESTRTPAGSGPAASGGSGPDGG